MKKLTYILVILFWSVPWICEAQQKKSMAAPQDPIADSLGQEAGNRVGLIAKAYGDSIILRWAPSKSTLFKPALVSGYLITRRSIGAGQKENLDFQIIVKPWKKEEWLRNVSRNDTLAAVSNQLVNGKNSSITSLEAVTLDKVMQQQNQDDIRMMMALLIADVKPVYAVGMGLGWVDRKVEKGKSYSYFVMPLVNQELYPVAPGATLVVNSKSDEIKRMPEVKATSGDHTISLSWNRVLTESMFSSYFIERSDNDGKTFRRLNTTPWIQPPTNALDETIIFKDSVKTNYLGYQYRVIGIGPFGDLAPSGVLKVMAVDLTAPKPVVGMKAKYQGKSTVQLTWAYDNPDTDFAGFIVGKSTAMEGPYTPLHTSPLTRNVTSFLDSAAIPYNSYYYKIVAVDTARNLAPGLPVYCFINDKKGPSKPTGLQGYIDKTGFVRLVWDAGKEPNIYGYKVMSANAPDHVFAFNTPGFLVIPGFNDSTALNTLTKNKYFRVIAYDNNLNASEASDLLILTRPDIIPPVAPIIKNYVVRDSAVVLNWYPSASKDVKSQILMRRGKSTERWTEVAKLNPDVTTYHDTGIKGESDYGYALVAVDSAGLKSEVSFPLNVKTPRISPVTVKKLRAFLNPDKSVSLYWDYDVPNCRFTIFKAMGNETFRSVDAVYDSREYRDKRPEKGKTRYAIRVMYKDGRASKFSDVIEVDVL